MAKQNTMPTPFPIEVTTVKAEPRALKTKWRMIRTEEELTSNELEAKMDNYAYGEDPELYDELKKPSYGTFAQLINWLTLLDQGSFVDFYKSHDIHKVRAWCETNIQGYYEIIYDLECQTDAAVFELTSLIVKEALDENGLKRPYHFPPTKAPRMFEDTWFATKRQLLDLPPVPLCRFAFLNPSDAILFKLTWGGE